MPKVNYSVAIAADIRIDLPESWQDLPRNEMMAKIHDAIADKITVLDVVGARGGAAIDNLTVTEAWA